MFKKTFYTNTVNKDFANPNNTLGIANIIQKWFSLKTILYSDVTNNWPIITVLMTMSLLVLCMHLMPFYYILFQETFTKYSKSKR